MEIRQGAQQNAWQPLAPKQQQMGGGAREKGWLDYDKAMTETLTSIHRAGADVILTYCAKDFARLYRNL